MKREPRHVASEASQSTSDVFEDCVFALLGDDSDNIEERIEDAGGIVTSKASNKRVCCTICARRMKKIWRLTGSIGDACGSVKRQTK